MRLGLYVDMRNSLTAPHPWADHYARWLDRVQQAEAHGADAVWLSEHHFFDDGYLSQTWTLAAAFAARTHRIRIGTAVALLPLHSVLDLAEQVALVDLLSGGRVEAGFGVGYRKVEYQAFGGEFKRRYGVFEERIHALRQHWGQEPGELPVVTPGPLQSPVPLWGGFAGPLGAKICGRLGIGLQLLDPALLAPYLAGLDEGGHPRSAARMGGHIDFLLADDPERAWAVGRQHIVERWNSYDRHTWAGTGRPAPEPSSGENWRDTGRFVVGTPEEVAKLIRRRTDGLPVTDVWCWADHPGMDDELVDRHLELMFTELRPLLAQSTDPHDQGSLTPMSSTSTRRDGG
jgi:alkanesulfonate monooxygenase SsuD/methylene tetrahydromethanopterin reductase-like flavin-dependent oxidoreductase (luciferase family)